MRTVAIDAGSSYLKVYDGHRQLMIPSAIHRLLGAADYADAITVGGIRYAVGHTALLGRTKAEAEPHIERGFHGSSAQHVELCYALAQIGASGEHDTLALSLPYADSQDQALRERVKTQSFFRWQDNKGNEHSATFRRVTIMPQGVGALRVFQSQQRHTPRVATLVDVGSCTLDVVTVLLDPRTSDYVYNADACASFRDVSVTSFKRDWESRIRRLDGMQTRRLGYHQLMSLAMENQSSPSYLRLRQGPEQIDVSAEYEQAAVELTTAIYERVRGVTADVWPDIESIILTGGGVALVDDVAWPDWARTTRLDVFANVRGQYLASNGAQGTEEAVA